jgi:hypothetical protein
MKKIGGRVDVYLVDPSSSTSWATFPVASGGGGGVGGEGNGGGAPRLVDAFTFVLFGAEFFGLTRDAFDFVATAGATDSWNTCVIARRCFTTLVDDTMVATSAGVAGVVGGAVEGPATAGEGDGTCELATAATLVGSRLMGEKSDYGGAEEGEGAQIDGGGGGWEELKLPSRAK